MGVDETVTLDAPIGQREILDKPIAICGCRMATMRTSSLKPLGYLCLAAAMVLLVSVGGTAAQLKSGGPAAAQPKNILIVHTFGPNFEQGAAWNREILRELNEQSPWPLNIQEQSLITALDGNAAAEAKFFEYLRALYAQRSPDLIVSLGGPAALFICQHKADLFPTTPMLLAAVEARRVDPSMVSNQDVVAGAWFDQVSAIENVLRLLPETKTIAIILGMSPGERFWAGEHQRLLRPLLKDKVELIFYGEQRLDEILKAVASLPPHSAIFYQQLAVDGAGVVYGDKEPLKRIYAVANAPIFSYDQTYFNGEIVGGPMFSPTEGAKPTAAVAVRMLGGEKADSIKVPVISFSTPKYDWRQLQRWNISESRLPPGSEILFREQSVWERYRWQIALVAAVMLAQAGLISAMLQERRRRQLAELQSRQRMAELAHVNRFSTAGELTASIAHEINQPLGAILTNAETLDAILQSPIPDIAELKDIVKDILDDDRRASEVIRRLRSLLKKAPFELKNLDLNDVVRDTVEFISALAIARKVELTSVISPDPLPILGDRIQLQQVVLNLVMNGIDATKDTPSENRNISIRTSRVENFAQISVSDRGPGIPESQLKEVFEPFYTSKAEGMGMGLSIARTIIEAHHGLIWAENRDRGGSSFRIRLPLVQ
jgi:signal transduction histidine kinase